MTKGIWRSIRCTLASCAAALGLTVLLAQCQPAPACDAAATCGSGQVRACIDKCVTPVPVNGKCSTDLCAADGYCADGATCVSFSNNGVGSCLQLGLTLTVPCEGAGGDLCTNETYCRPSCGGSTTRRCALPTAVGGACDGDLPQTEGQPLGNLCTPCEVGSHCAASKVCHKRCEVDADCPCDIGGALSSYNCVGIAGQEKLCYHCASAGLKCKADNPVCCDGSTCGAGAVCCWPNAGPACSNSTECCGKDLACVHDGASQKTCGACHSVQAFCDANDQCCAGLSCQGGKCAPLCVQGETCATGWPGVCSVGTRDCTNPSNPTCVPKIKPGMQADNNCDGLDNNCDGKIDEGYVPTACSGTPTGCQTSFTAKGMTKCLPGSSPSDKVSCVLTAGTDYCNHSDGSNKCGFDQAMGCNPYTDFCTPGFTCRAGNFVGCSPQDSSVGCWPTSAANSCNPCGPNICWLPNTVNSYPNKCPP